ncbi:MAG: NTP transferase domain-containing protein [Clostridia bacterium]|nr:NTP transferase domain-containing protein [Clostridia bacterium]
MGKSAVILAGGEGKRMKSDKPKALSEVLNRPMLRWVLDAVTNSGINNICVLTGFGKDFIEDYLSEYSKETGISVSTAYQAERRGTGHAVMMCRDFLCRNSGDVAVLNGDAPFMDSAAIVGAFELHKNNKSSATVISAKVDNPFGYGRIIRSENGSVSAIVEQKDTNDEQKNVNEVNSGCYWFNTQDLLGVLDELTDNNASGEYYLTDTLGLLLNKGKTVCAYTADSSYTVLGANDPAQLEQLNEIAKTITAKI